MDKGAQVFRTARVPRSTCSASSTTCASATRTSHVDDKGKRFNTDLLEAVELGFLLDIAEVVVYAAQNRQESRGGHMRDDFPKRDDENYMKHTMAYLTGDPHSSDAGRPHQARLEARRVHQERAGRFNYPPMERKY